jgi:hypothetical protein
LEHKPSDAVAIIQVLNQVLSVDIKQSEIKSSGYTPERLVKVQISLYKKNCEVVAKIIAFCIET